MKNIIFANTCTIILALALTAYTTVAPDVHSIGFGETVSDGIGGSAEMKIGGYGVPEIGLDSSKQSNTSLSTGTYNQSSHKKGVDKQDYFIQGHRGYTSYGRTYGDNGYVYPNRRHTDTLLGMFNQDYADNISDTYNQDYASNISEIYDQGTYKRSHQIHASFEHPRNTHGGYGYSEQHLSRNISVTYNNHGNFTNPFIKQGDVLGNGSRIFHGRNRNAQESNDFPKQGYSGNIYGTINHSTFRDVVLYQGNLVPGHGSHVSDGHGRNAHRGYDYSNQDHSGNILARLNNQDNFKNFFSNQGGLIIGHGVLAGHGNIQ